MVLGGGCYQMSISLHKSYLVKKCTKGEGVKNCPYGQKNLASILLHLAVWGVHKPCKEGFSDIFDPSPFVDLLYKISPHGL